MSGWSESYLWVPSVGDGFVLHLVDGGGISPK